MIKVLHNKWIAKLGEIGDGVDVISKVRPVFQAEPVAAGGNILSNSRGSIQQWILILNIPRFEPRLAVVVLPVIDNWIEADGRPPTAKVIEPNAPPDVICDRERHLSEE